MCKKRLDINERMPDGMQEYLDTYGWHFNHKLCEWAVKRMFKTDARTGKEEHIPYTEKSAVEEFLKRFGVDSTKYIGYDHIFVYHMAKADFFGSSLTTDQQLAMYIKDYLSDPDGYDEIAMTRFYADCIGKGEMPDWPECI